MHFSSLTPVRSKTVLGLVLAAAAAIAATTVAFAAAPASSVRHSHTTTTSAPAIATTTVTDVSSTVDSQDSATAGNGQAADHGATVEAAVAACKAALKPGEHGIGQCVSAVANKHGKTVSAAAQAAGHPTK